MGATYECKRNDSIHAQQHRTFEVIRLAILVDMLDSKAPYP